MFLVPEIRRTFIHGAIQIRQVFRVYSAHRSRILICRGTNHHCNACPILPTTPLGVFKRGDLGQIKILIVPVAQHAHIVKRGGHLVDVHGVPAFVQHGIGLRANPVHQCQQTDQKPGIPLLQFHNFTPN